MELGVYYQAIPPEAKPRLDAMLAKAHGRGRDPSEAAPFLGVLLPPVLGPAAGVRGLFLFVYPDRTHALVLLTEDGDRDRIEAAQLHAWLSGVTGILDDLWNLADLAEHNERPDYYPELTGQVKHDG